MGRDDASLVATVACLTIAMLNGYSPTIPEAAEIPIPGFQFQFNFIFTRWATEGIYSLLVQDYLNIYKVENSTSHFGYVINREGFDMLIMFGLGMLGRVVAYFLMIILNRERQGLRPLVGIPALGI